MRSRSVCRAACDVRLHLALGTVLEHGDLVRGVVFQGVEQEGLPLDRWQLVDQGQEPVPLLLRLELSPGFRPLPRPGSGPPGVSVSSIAQELGPPLLLAPRGARSAGTSRAFASSEPCGRGSCLIHRSRAFVEEIGEPEIQGQLPRAVRESLPGQDHDLVEQVVHRQLPPMQRPVLLQHPHLAAGMVAEEAEVRAEQPEEVLPPPVLHVPLQEGPGRAQVGPVAALALVDVILPDQLLVPLDLLDELVRDPVHGGLRILVVRLGRQRPGRQPDDPPDLVPRVPASPVDDG